MHFIGAMPDSGCSCGCSHRNVCSSHEAAPQVSGGKSGIVLLLSLRRSALRGWRFRAGARSRHAPVATAAAANARRRGGGGRRPVDARCCWRRRRSRPPAVWRVGGEPGAHPRPTCPLDRRPQRVHPLRTGVPGRLAQQGGADGEARVGGSVGNKQDGAPLQAKNNRACTAAVGGGRAVPLPPPYPQNRLPHNTTASRAQ